jgi:hypothetical protein
MSNVFARFGDPFDHFRDLFGEGFSRFKSNKEQQNIFHRQAGLQKNCTTIPVPWYLSADTESHDHGANL